MLVRVRRPSGASSTSGRSPWCDTLSISAFRWESADALAIAAQALDTMGLQDMHSRDILTLSGGERRRLFPTAGGAWPTPSTN